MEYGRSAHDVIIAIRDVQDRDGSADWARAIGAVTRLYPFSALAYALHQGDVWPRQARIRAVKEGLPTCGNLFLEDLIDAAETSAAADGAHLVTEVHLARAIRKLGPDLASLGISAETLVTRVEERAGPPPGVIVPKRPRVVGAARKELLATALAGQSLDAVLDREERSRTVERKRSLLNKEREALAAHEQAAVALVNGNPETAVYFIFGQEDDLTTVGEVDHEGRPMSPLAVRSCQARLDKKLQACVPPVTVRWESVERDGKTMWIACLMGRARGTAHQTSTGAYPYRSGEDTYFASPELIMVWLREPAAGNIETGADEDRVANVPSLSLPSAAPRAERDDPGAEQRIVLAQLNEAVEAFFATPPEIPHSVQGHTLDDWRPVVTPILDVFRSTMDEVVEHGIKTDADGLARIGRGIRSVFRLDRQRGGLTWLVEAPRLITRLIADRLLVDAYCSDPDPHLAELDK